MGPRGIGAAAVLWLAAASAARADDDFAGHYGHDYTDPAGATVWDVQVAGEGYRVTTTADGESAPAHAADVDGRARFWERMMWPEETSAAAHCLNWGAPTPSTLAEALGTLLDEEDSAEAETSSGTLLGASMLCRVPAAVRVHIDWLAGNASDWFYYDPMLGVTEVTRLP